MEFNNIFSNIIFFIILINGYNILITIVGFFFILLRLLLNNFYNIVIIVTLFSFLNHIFIYQGLNKSYPQTCNCIFIIHNTIVDSDYLSN